MIDKLKFRSYKVLPVVYDEALSYYEVLNKLADKVNECIDAVNEVTEALEEADLVVMKQDIVDLKGSSTSLQLQINELQEQIESLEGDSNIYVSISDDYDLYADEYGVGIEVPEDFDPEENAIYGVKFFSSASGDATLRKRVSTAEDYYVTYTDSNTLQIKFKIYNLNTPISITIGGIRNGDTWTFTGGWQS